MPAMASMKEYQGPIIDTHAFLGSSEAFKVLEPTDPYFKEERFKRTQFLVMPFSAAQNLEVIEKVAGDDKFLGSYVMFNPNEASPLHVREDGFDAVRGASNHENVVGMKSHPSIFRIPMNDKRFNPYYELASRRKLPVLLHTASSGKEYDSAGMATEVMERNPDLKLILAHFGGLKPNYMEEAAKLLDKFPNLYLNTTGLDQMGRNRQVSNSTFERRVLHDLSDDEVVSMRRDAAHIIKGVVAKHPKKVLFGSDTGFHLPEDFSIWPLQELTVGEQFQVLYFNPKKLFRNMKAA